MDSFDLAPSNVAIRLEGAQLADSSLSEGERLKQQPSQCQAHIHVDTSIRTAIESKANFGSRACDLLIRDPEFSHKAHRLLGLSPSSSDEPLPDYQANLTVLHRLRG